MNITEYIISKIHDFTGLKEKEIEVESEIQSIGLNSVSFVGLVLDIENKYNFEFDDDKLSSESFLRVSDLILYVSTKTNE